MNTDPNAQTYVIAETLRGRGNYHIRAGGDALCGVGVSHNTDIPLEAWGRGYNGLHVRWCKRCQLLMAIEVEQRFRTEATPKAGDVVFFSKCRRTLVREKSVEVGFKGSGYGVMLGIVPAGAPEPPQVILRRQMGEIGYVTFDDVIAFLGEVSGAEVVEKFKDKYYGPVVRSEDPAPPLQLVSGGNGGANGTGDASTKKDSDNPNEL